MSAETETISTVETRARETAGTSGQAIYAAVAAEINARNLHTGVLFDIGCGTARLAQYVRPMITEYVGVDVVEHVGLDPAIRFIRANLDLDPWPLEPESADIVTSVETIEHLENPRQHFRQLTRIAKPGGLIIVTTPNNLSWLSLFTLLTKGVFNAFQEKPGLYPAHITALVETDLVRLSLECGLSDVRIHFTDNGRMPLMSKKWPRPLRGRRFSDNIILSARR